MSSKVAAFEREPDAGTELSIGSKTGPIIEPSGALRDFLMAHWPIVLGFAAMAIATVIRLGQQVWPLETGAHGPIVLATGIWLLVHIRQELISARTPPPLALTILGFVLAVPIYVFGRAFDLLAVEAVGLYLFFLSLCVLIIGLRPLRENPFPFLYLAFLIPIPGYVLDKITVPLQHLVSRFSTELLQSFGYPIAREGIVIFIAQYQLLVEDACSGMNSLIGLSAVMLFYIYILHGASLRYAGLLSLAIVPIAVFVNIIRVTALILLTYYAGDAVAQGFLHVTTGIVLFALALGLTILLDMVLQNFLLRRRERAAIHA